MMIKTLPGWERTLRVLLGVALLAYALVAYPHLTKGYIIAAIGVVMIVTGLFAYCPACAIAGRKPAT